MVKKTILVIMAMLLGIAANAQQRYIARGAVEGELYYSVDWLQYHSPAGIDSMFKAIFHITENGKKMDLNYSVKYQPPDALTGDALPMQPDYVIADATPGVVYNTDWYMAYENGQPYDFDRLWFSDDYGKTWKLRDVPEYESRYYISNFKGLIYRGGGGIYKSTNYGETFSKMEGANNTPSNGELGWREEEAFGVGIIEPYKGILAHTLDFFRTYTQISIDSQYVYVEPEIFRGGLPGEVYVTSFFPDGSFRVSFSADTGYHFRVVHRGGMPFMSDRKAGDFYIVTNASWGAKNTETRESWIGYARPCVEYYTNYGETLVGIYCHDFPEDYAENQCAGVLDMEAEVVDKNNVSLRWNALETETPPIAYRVYRDGVLLQELQQTTYVDESLPDGSYVYFIRALYADGCESLSYNIARIKIQNTGIGEKEKDDGIVVYPNPASGELQVTSYK